MNPLTVTPENSAMDPKASVGHLSKIISPGTPPPQNEEIEMSILCCMMIDRKAYQTAIDSLEREDFYRLHHQVLFDAIIATWNDVADNEELDLVGLQTTLEKSGHMEDIGGQDYMLEIADYGAVRSNINTYIRNLKEASKRRQAIQRLEFGLKDAYRPDVEITETILTVRSSLNSLISKEGVSEEPVAYQSFPVDALPEPARAYLQESAETLGCDPGYIALPMLSAIAGAVGNSRCIQLKRGWTEPAVIWSAIIGESGTMKSPAFNIALKPVEQKQQKALKQYQFDMAEYKEDLNKCEEGQTQPDRPTCQRLIVDNTTIEALGELLESSPKGLLLARDELAGWLGSFNAYKSGKSGSDEAGWLSMFRAERVFVDRKTGDKKLIYIPRAAVSITGGIQPGILQRGFTQEHRESGLLARFLLAMPPRKRKIWTEREVDVGIEEAYIEMFENLLDMQMKTDASGESYPLKLGLTPEAKAVMIPYLDAHNASGVDLEGEQAASWAKLEAYSARLSLMVHLIRVAGRDVSLRDEQTIDHYSVEAAVTLNEWLKVESIRIYNIFTAQAKKATCEKLVKKIQRRGGRVTPREWANSRSKKTVGEARQELQMLVDGKYGRFETTQTGGRDSEAFVCFCMPDS